MYKNVASQKLTVYAFDSTTNLPKTGDAANITAYVDIDDAGLNVLGDTSATERDSTNAKGYYLFDLTQGETNGNKLLFTAKSATANIVVLAMPAVIYTVPANFTLLSIDSNGRADIIKIAGTTQTARDLGASVLLSAGSGAGQLDFTSGVVKANLTQILATALTETSGQIAAAFKKFFDIASPTSTINRITLVDTVTTNTDMISQANVRTAVGLATANLDTQLGNIRTDTNTTIPGLIAALNNLSAAQVKTQMTDALNVDTYAQPGQATPAATTTIRLMLAYLYKAWRNKTTQTATEYDLYNDDAATVDQKATFGDDGTTATRGEVATGP